MLDKTVIRDEPDRVRRALARRQLPTAVVDEFLSVDARWRADFQARTAPLLASLEVPVGPVLVSR